jgi:hypothetical protein
VQLLYPSDYFDKSKPDELYADECLAARVAGFSCSVYSPDDFDSGRFRPRPALAEQEDVAYRGWMLTPVSYGRLLSAVEEGGGTMLTSVAQYCLCHHLPEWYAAVEEFTPSTVVLAKDADYESALTDKGWSAYFVKDYVKSLTTSRGSVAKSVAEITEIVGLIEKYRGEIEGGVCVRHFESFLPGTEERYFVYRGRAYAKDGSVPPIVEQIALRIDSPFFSVDIAQRDDGVARLIELGDGQVSHRKEWEPDQFIEIFLDTNKSPKSAL